MEQNVNELLEALVTARLSEALSADAMTKAEADKSALEWMKVYTNAAKMSNEAIRDTNAAEHETARLDFEKSKLEKELDVKSRELDIREETSDSDASIRNRELDLRKSISDAENNLREREIEAKNREIDTRANATETEMKSKEMELQFHQSELEFERVKQAEVARDNAWKNTIASTSTIAEPITKLICVGASMAMLTFAADLVVKQQQSMANYEQNGVFVMSPSKMVFNPIDLLKNVVTKNIF